MRARIKSMVKIEETFNAGRGVTEDEFGYEDWFMQKMEVLAGTEQDFVQYSPLVYKLESGGKLTGGNCYNWMHEWLEFDSEEHETEFIMVMNRRYFDE